MIFNSLQISLMLENLYLMLHMCFFSTCCKGNGLSHTSHQGNQERARAWPRRKMDESLTQSFAESLLRHHGQEFRSVVLSNAWALGRAGSGAEGAGKPRPCCRQLGGTASQQRATQENHIKALLDPNFQVSKPHILLNTFIFTKRTLKKSQHSAFSGSW